MEKIPKVDTNVNPSSYFFTPQDDERPSFMEKNKPFFDRFHYYLVQIWPYVTKVFTVIVYFFIGFIKAFIKIIVEQIKSVKS